MLYNIKIGGSSQGKIKYTNIFKKPLFHIRVCLVTSVARGDANQAFSGSRQPGSKDDIPGEGPLVLSHMAVGALDQAAEHHSDYYFYTDMDSEGPRQRGMESVRSIAE